MKEQGREKPKSVEVGQRWKEPDDDCCPYTITAVDPEKGAQIKFDDGARTYDYWYKLDGYGGILQDTYLGGPSPSPEGVGRVMEANERGYPVACLQCGGRVPRVRSFVCVDCFPQPNGISDAMALEWKRGARDFPRSPAPVPVAPAGVVWQGSIDGETWCEMPQVDAVEYPKSREYVDGRLVAEFYRDEAGRFHAATLNPRVTPYAPPPPCKHCGEAVCRCKLPPPKPPLYGRAVGEMRDQGGAPMTALQAIQSRPKPEPWVESCDPLFWIPDANERT